VDPEDEFTAPGIEIIIRFQFRHGLRQRQPLHVELLAKLSNLLVCFLDFLFDLHFVLMPIY
jgi:hypothetical protein